MVHKTYLTANSAISSEKARNSLAGWFSPDKRYSCASISIITLYPVKASFTLSGVLFDVEKEDRGVSQSSIE